MKGKHKTLQKDLKRSVLWLEKQPNVNKVILSFTECCRHKYPPGYIRCKQELEGGLTANGYSGTGVTDLFIRVTPATAIKEVKALILKKFPE